MADPFKKVQAGQSLDISAQAWNAFLDNARSQKSKKHDELAEPPEMFRQADIIKVRNDSGQDCNRFSVLGIGAPIISPTDNLREFKNQVAVSGAVPQHPQHFGKFVILLEPLRNGKIGRAWVSGVCPAYVYVEDACHNYADVADGEVSALFSRPSGSARILWRAGGSGFQWAVIRLSNTADDIRRFKLAQPLSRCGSAAANRVIADATPYGNPTWCATDCSFVVYDSLGVVGETPAPTGSYGWAKWMPDSGKWELLQLGEGCCGSSSDSSSSESSASSNSESSGSSSDSHSSESSTSDSSLSGSSGSSGLSSGSESTLSSSFSNGSSSGDSASGDSSSGVSSSGDSSSGDSTSDLDSGSSSGDSNSSSFSQSTASSYSASLISGDVITASNNDKIENSSSNSGNSLGSGQTSSSGDMGGLTAVVDVLIPCPSSEAGVTTFPTQRLTFVNGLLQHIESGSPCTIGS